MSNLMKFAESELDLIGLNDGDEMNGAMRKHILHMIHEFSEEGHSGFSASYAVNLLSKLLKYEPLTPLTGEDSEWMEIAKEMSGSNVYQNKRLSRVFKDDTGAYDSQGKIFWEWYSSPNVDDGKPYKTYFTSSDSRVPITFPYTPTQVYEERVGGE